MFRLHVPAVGGEPTRLKRTFKRQDTSTRSTICFDRWKLLGDA
ncbi:hypothetical protein GJR88_03514 [Dietzia sp. DQ12-45-1b]|nr:hypothetical protein GJR88_03514 [Dietzia sp. DQ12-45-1b]